MLATTYSITVLNGEQRNARRILSILQAQLQQDVQHAMEGREFNWLQKAFRVLVNADTYCRGRKIELYVIPALRNISSEGDVLLQRLETQALDRVRILAYLDKQLRRAAEGLPVDAGTLVSTMRLYCDEMHKRLQLEDQEILPLARRVLTEEEWSCVASQCLSHQRARSHLH